MEGFCIVLIRATRLTVTPFPILHFICLRVDYCRTPIFSTRTFKSTCWVLFALICERKLTVFMHILSIDCHASFYKSFLTYFRCVEFKNIWTIWSKIIISREDKGSYFRSYSFYCKFLPLSIGGHPPLLLRRQGHYVRCANSFESYNCRTLRFCIQKGIGKDPLFLLPWRQNTNLE